MFLFFLLLAGCTADPPRIEPAVPLRILFIGNSLTYTNNLPGMLEKMSANETPPLHCESVTFPGASLAFHRALGVAENKIKSHPWDYVILQDYSVRPLDHPDATTTSVRNFSKTIQAAGAHALLFENWSRQDRPGSHAALRADFEQISRDTNVPLVRIGEAWHVARDHLPWFKPFIDERHPSLMGTYLAACVFFETIYHHAPPDAPLPKGISTAQAAAIQEIAHEPPAAYPSPTITTSK
jgi:hypothetical protein